MAVPALQMDSETAANQILKILYRKQEKGLVKDEIEKSFRRSVDSAGLSVRRVVNAALKKLSNKGNVKMDGRNNRYKWVTSKN